jgi:hypothetical protein
MGTLNEDLSAIKTVEDTLTSNKVARFAYTDLAYTNNDANGVAEYNVNNEQNIPVATANVMKVNDTVLSKGYRAQASSVTRMLLNHFLGRLSYNLNKVNDNMSNLLATLISHRGTANGLATLDADGRIPYSQLPESAVELKGYWNANTNTPTLADGTGDDGDEYYVDVAGSQDLGSGTQYFNVGDRVLYIDGVWKNINSTAVKSVNSVLPNAQGNVALPTKVISLDNTLTVTGAPAISAGDTIKALFTANITGTDSATAMSISYNGTSYTVKVPKEGVFSDFVATELTTGNFTYIDAYKYVEFMLNGSNQLVIIGNPLVLSGENYEVYADGYINLLKYSTDEINTGKKWIDGKPIYQKTINCGELPNSTNKQIPHGITNLDTLIRMSGCANSNNSVYITLPLSGVHPADIYINTSNLIIFTTDNRAGYYGYVTVEYTKTTN